MTYDEAIRAIKSQATLTVVSGRHAGTSGTATGIAVLFGKDHVSITPPDGKRIGVPIANAEVA